MNKTLAHNENCFCGQPGHKKIVSESPRNPFTVIKTAAYLCKTHFNQIMRVGKQEDSRQLKFVGFE